MEPSIGNAYLFFLMRVSPIVNECKLAHILDYNQLSGYPITDVLQGNKRPRPLRGFLSKYVHHL